MKRQGIKSVLSALALVVGLQSLASAKTISFSGYDWDVKSGNNIGPGPCDWDEDNAWVDANGYLHLKLSKVNGVWYSAEVNTQQRLGFGTYQFWVIGRIDTLDPNVVFGMFNYPTPDVGPDGTNEIDIEIARWGDPNNENLNYVVWPARTGVENKGYATHFSLGGSFTTHRFNWSSTDVLFQSLHGHRNNNNYEFGRWHYTPNNPLNRIAQEPMPVRLNLWLFQNAAPTDGNEVEVVIRSFTYTP